MISYDHKNQHVQSLFIRKFLRVSLSNRNHFFVYLALYICDFWVEINSHAGGVRYCFCGWSLRKPFYFDLLISDPFLNFRPRMTFNKLEKNFFTKIV